MKKLLFVVVALGLSTGFAKSEKKSSRKPNQITRADAVKEACDNLSSSLFEAGAICAKEASGTTSDTDEGRRSDVRSCIQSVSSDCVQQYSK